MNGYVDLHTHTAASDGTESPASLVGLALSAGLSAVAITDHDTVSGLDEATCAGKKLGITVVRGVELAVATPYGEAHLLGLWLPGKMPELTAALEKIRRDRDARNREMVRRFQKAGYAVSYQELLAVAAGESVGRPHMARLLVQKGICSTVREAFAAFLGDDKRMYVPRVLPSPEEGLALLREQDATTVFAHPMLLRAAFSELDALVGEFSALGLDALEAFHSEQDGAASRKVKALAAKYGLGLSGGSDFHGGGRPEVVLGRAWGSTRIPGSVMENLLARRREKGLPVPENDSAAP